MNMLTVPKIKDLVNKPNQQYKDILDTLNNTKKEDTMTNELSSFLNELKKTTVPETNRIGANSIGTNGIGTNGIGANSIGATPIESLDFNNVSYSPY